MKTGERIGRYQIVDEIGRGGMATVYRALDKRLNRHVALKLLAPNLTHDPRFVQRFERETRIIVRLEHANIVPVYDAGVHGEQPFLVMRLLEGGSLRKRIDGIPLPLRRLWSPLRRIAVALDAAHAQNIIHRDLKPTNILFDEHGSAFVSDFGIAKLLNSTTHLTGSHILGSPPYMSPEQFRSDNIDGRSDQYNLAIVIFHLLSGRLPFEGDTVQLMYKHLHEPPPPLHAFNNNCSPAVSRVLERALAKRPAARYASTMEFINALEEATTMASNKRELPADKKRKSQKRPRTPDVANKSRRQPELNERRKRSVAALSAKGSRAQTHSASQLDPITKPGAGGTSETKREIGALLRNRRPAVIIGGLLLLLIASYLILVNSERDLTTGTGVEDLATLEATTVTATSAAQADPESSSRVSIHVLEASGTDTWYSAGESSRIDRGDILTLPLTSTLTIETNANRLGLQLSDERTLIIAPASRITLHSANGQIHPILLREGSVVIASGTGPALITNPYGAEAKSDDGVLGVRYSQQPFAFEVSCLAGSCTATGDLSGEALLEQGDASTVDGSGQPGMPGPARYDEFEHLVFEAWEIPTATATATPTPSPPATATATPTQIFIPPTPTATNIRPPGTAIATLAPSTAEPPSNVGESNLPSATPGEPTPTSEG